ncbi:C40 family peptidase [Lacinutrix neustonica]|uniref:C40 family peptidase n=1 Tax=Lacinutrix neustonica TaxID=2980107 RepID=UPI0028BE4B32|nr:NlpC/P60 family protein [Lacinutrix neustonica]
MRHITLLLLLIVFSLTSCGSAKTKRVITTKSKTTKSARPVKSTKTVVRKSTLELPLAKDIIKNAEKYEGTRYKYGGTTKKGMDCSGLIYTAFKEEHVTIPRVSHAMAKSATG